MELKSGYKQTEAGVIPEDWETRRVGELFDFANGRPHESHLQEGGRFCLITLDSINISGSLKKTHKQTDAWDNSLRKGDLVAVLSDLAKGDLLGLCDLIPEDNLYVLNQRMGRLRERTPVNSYFARLQINSRQAHFKARSQGSAQRHVYRRDFDALPIPYPSLYEQDCIADAISLTEDLLSSLEELINKKQFIRQAAMQELLTGKRRLPGFEGEWEAKRLGDEIRDLEAGVSVRSTIDKDQSSTGRYILRTSAVSQGRFSPTETKEIISCDISRAKTPIKAGDLIISRMNTPALVGECGYSHSDHPNLFLPDRLWRAAYRDPQAVSSRWLSYTLSTQQNRTRIKELATGTSGSMKNISKRALLDLEIKWPSLDEQDAIAEVLSEMDDEIDSINQQLQKAQAVKQGLMQQLLTGKIRLK